MSLDQEIPKTPFKFMLSIIAPDKKLAISSFSVVTLALLMGRSREYLIKLFTDSASLVAEGKTSYDDLWYYGIAFIVITFVMNLVWRVSGFISMRWITGGIARINQTLFDYLSLHSIDYFNDRFAGSLVNKISNVSRGFDALASKIQWGFYTVFMTMVMYVGMLYSVNFYLCMIIFIFTVLFISLNIFIATKLKKYYFSHAKAGSILKGKFVDSTSNISSVQFSPALDYEQEYMSGYIEKERSTHLKAWRLLETAIALNNVITTMFIGVLLCTSMYLFQHKSITIGDLLMLFSIMVTIERFLRMLADEIANSMQSYSQIEEGLDEILLPHNVTNIKDAQGLIVSNGSIDVENISFGYGELGLFDNFNLEIKAGEKIGLVGRSGGGKSTFMSLILRQNDLISGNILIDGQDVGKVTKDSLRANIAYVPQSTELFHRTIFENILYGNLNASKEEVVEAAKLAQADEFINSLPKGYETYVGERGVKLSGGQRQRIAIARAILKNSAILFLDEATSALDSESEEAVQVGLENLMKGKTTLAIAHRLSTLRRMDRLIVIDDGKIIESGTHEELLEKKGVYSTLWESQVGGFL